MVLSKLGQPIDAELEGMNVKVVYTSINLIHYFNMQTVTDRLSV